MRQATEYIQYIKFKIFLNLLNKKRPIFLFKKMFGFE